MVEEGIPVHWAEDKAASHSILRASMLVAMLSSVVLSVALWDCRVWVVVDTLNRISLVSLIPAKWERKRGWPYQQEEEWERWNYTLWEHIQLFKDSPHISPHIINQSIEGIIYPWVQEVMYGNHKCTCTCRYNVYVHFLCTVYLHGVHVHNAVIFMSKWGFPKTHCLFHSEQYQSLE